MTETDDIIGNLVEVAQAGAIPMLTIAVYALWRRLNAVTDAFNQYLIDSAKNGDSAAQRAIEKH